jgi:hypothetical protein
LTRAAPFAARVFLSETDHPQRPPGTAGRMRTSFQGIRTAAPLTAPRRRSANASLARARG